MNKIDYKKKYLKLQFGGNDDFNYNQIEYKKEDCNIVDTIEPYHKIFRVEKENENENILSI